MRFSAWSSPVISACRGDARLAVAFGVLLLALALAAPAGAHVDATPAFLSTNAVSTLSLTGHTDREVAMTGFSVTVPTGVRILEALPLAGWRASLDGETATWDGGNLAGAGDATFELELDVSAPAGPLELEVEQLYPEGDVVGWPVRLTVTPETVAPAASARSTWAVIVTAGLLVAGALFFLARQRRNGPLQEK
jgi:hypothetical protein